MQDISIALINRNSKQVSRGYGENDDIFRSLLAQGMRRRGAVSLLDNRVVSVEYDLSVEWGGAASGDQWVDAVVVDLADGSLLGPLDLFYDDSPWLETLAAVATADLEGRFGANVVWPDGLAVEVANFENLALSEDGVILLFDRYQVGPGVLGAPRVVVPWSEIGVFIDPNGPVGHLVAG